MSRARPSARVARHSSARRPRSLEPLEPRTLMATLFVTSVDDSGPGTLRQAILEANQNPTADVINFAIPGDDVYKTIRPLSPLPDITSPLTLDGRTQPGAANAPVVELDGSAAGAAASGLVVSAPNCTLRALAINRFAAHGVVINGTAPARAQATNAHVEGCYIGTDVTGNVDLGNGGAGVVVSASQAVIGATTAIAHADTRNVISGNGGPGVWLAGIQQAITSTSVANNYIGTTAAGTRALGNGREGVLIEGSVRATIGGPVVRNIQNIISGNAGSGVRVALSTALTDSIVMQGNFIGTDLSGENALPNGHSPALPYRDGVTVNSGGVLVGSTSGGNLISGNAGSGVNVIAGTVPVIGNLIGTDGTGQTDLGNRDNGVLMDAAASGRVTGNVISGNGRSGVRIARGTVQSLVAGNYIGTTATGNAPLGNDGDGVVLDNVRVPITVGGLESPALIPGQRLSPGAVGRNVISANGGNGVLAIVDFGATSTTGAHQIINNYIGTDATGTIPLGNRGSGVYLDNISRAVVGGTPPMGNVISANGGNGVTLAGANLTNVGSRSEANRIEGNYIGTAAPSSRTTPPTLPGTNTGMGNANHGVAIFNSSQNRVGGPTAGGTANVIAYNGGSGVLVQGVPITPTPTGTSTADGNLISGNSIYGNGGLGIDLAPGFEGVTPNDMLDADGGPNTLLNYPVIVSATTGPTGGSPVQVRYTLHSATGRTYRIEFFASPAPDATGRGEGRTYLGFTSASSDAGGNASGTFTAALPAGSGLFITATTTEVGRNNTSEFSPAVRAVPQEPPQPPVVELPASVVGRHVFYNDSAFDAVEPVGPGNRNGDDLAVAPDKKAMLPGQVSDYSNVTNYSKGINGVMIDVANLPEGATLTPDEFAIRRTTREDPGTFVEGEKPYLVTVRRGAGDNGSDRVSLFWADYDIVYEYSTIPVPAHLAVANGWLEVTMLPSAVSGLALGDTFYFGNLIAETGDVHDNAALTINAVDLAGIRQHQLEQPVPITSRFDINRDGAVNALDLGLARYSQLRRLPQLAIGIPVTPPGAFSEEANVLRELLL